MQQEPFCAQLELPYGNLLKHVTTFHIFFLTNTERWEVVLIYSHTCMVDLCRDFAGCYQACGDGPVSAWAEHDK